jgi:NAD dependent epimerase/dehydratase family enzyme
MHIGDVVSAICFLVDQSTLSGAFNLCAPELVTNGDFLRQIRHVLKRAALFAIPSPLLRGLLGELSTAVLDSQRCVPKQLLEEHFPFEYPYLEQALLQLLGRRR